MRPREGDALAKVVPAGDDEDAPGDRSGSVSPLPLPRAQHLPPAQVAALPTVRRPMAPPGLDVGGADAGELEERVTDQLRSLMTIAAAVTASHQFEDFLELAAEEALGAIDAASLAISRWEPERALLRTLVNVGDLAPWEERRPVDECYSIDDFHECAAMFERGECHLAVIDDPRLGANDRALLLQMGKESAVAVPILVAGAFWGELYVTTAVGQPRFRHDDVPLLEAVAAHFAAGVGQVEHLSLLSSYAYSDGLTGLANRRGFDERLQAVAEATDERPVSLVVCDVDGLKAVNDREGHEAGDRMLLRVAEALRGAAAMASNATTCRLGGDEFCLLLDGHGAETAQRVARHALDRLHVDGVSLACGVASGDAGTFLPGELLRAADLAQCEAKRRGPGTILIGPGPCDGATPVKSRPRSRPRRTGTNVGLLLDRAMARLDEEDPEADPGSRLRAVVEELEPAVDLSGWTVWWATEPARGERSVETLAARFSTPEMGEALLAAAKAVRAPRPRAVFEARVLPHEPQQGSSEVTPTLLVAGARTGQMVYGVCLAAHQSKDLVAVSSAVRLLVLAAVRGR